MVVLIFNRCLNMSMRPKDLVILKLGNDGNSDIDVEVDELFNNEENIE